MLYTLYNLFRKPDFTDASTILDLNYNFDSIDTIINDIETDILSLQANDHIHNTDTYLDYGGSNQVSAVDLADAVIKKHLNSLDHTQGTDQGLDTGGANAVIVSDLKDAVTKKHTAASDDNFNGLSELTTPSDNNTVLIYDGAYKKISVLNLLSRVSTAWTQETNFSSTPASTSTITMTSDVSAIIPVGSGLKYTISGQIYYGIVTAITSNLLTIAGASLIGTISNLYWSDPTRVIQLDFFIPTAFADAANTTLLATDAKTKFIWSLKKAYLVKIRHTVFSDDTGANQPRVNVSINGSAVGTSNTNAGLAVAETWTSTVIDINTSNYDINNGEAIEIITDANGSNDDAKYLTVTTVWVMP